MKEPNTLKILDKLCEHCRDAINQIPSKGDRPFKECPWRGISGDHCGEYEVIKNKLKFHGLDKHELIKRIFDYWGIKRLEAEKERNEAKHIDEKIRLSCEFSAFHRVICDIVKIINDYYKELINENREE